MNKESWNMFVKSLPVVIKIIKNLYLTQNTTCKDFSWPAPVRQCHHLMTFLEIVVHTTNL
jgi:capsule polysaccharide modification protein KpsS